MLSCNEVTRLYASDEIRQTRFAERVAVWLHLLMCRYCRRYVQELLAIGAASRQALTQSTVGNVDHAALAERLMGEIRHANKTDDGVWRKTRAV